MCHQNIITYKMHSFYAMEHCILFIYIFLFLPFLYLGQLKMWWFSFCSFVVHTIENQNMKYNAMAFLWISLDTLFSRYTSSIFSLSFIQYFCSYILYSLYVCVFACQLNLEKCILSIFFIIFLFLFVKLSIRKEWK